MPFPFERFHPFLLVSDGAPFVADCFVRMT
jgi:hypothetical protein